MLAQDTAAVYTPGQMDWVAIGAVATVIAAIATAILAGATYWLAKTTRDELQQAKQEIETAQRSLRVSQALAVEAEKARLDARGPRLNMRLEPVEWPPSGPSPLSGGLPPSQYQEGEKFRMPGAQNEPMILSGAGVLINEGQHSVRVLFNGLSVRLPSTPNARPGDPGSWEPVRPAGYEMTLPPGLAVSFRLEENRPVQQWVENGQARLRGEPGPNEFGAEIIAYDDFDNGVVDNFLIRIGGFPLEPVQGETDSWQIPATFAHSRPIHFTQLPRLRRYWRSKRANQELPTITLEPEPPTS